LTGPYWLLFPLHMLKDPNIRLENRGRRPVPGFAGLGETRLVAAHYPQEGGYTLGDTYVVYCSDEQIPLAWAYHPGGASEAKVVTTRGERQTADDAHRQRQVPDVLQGHGDAQK